MFYAGTIATRRLCTSYTPATSHQPPPRAPMDSQELVLVFAPPRSPSTSTRSTNTSALSPSPVPPSPPLGSRLPHDDDVQPGAWLGAGRWLVHRKNLKAITITITITMTMTISPTRTSNMSPRNKKEEEKNH
jgi:hypothetical protein